MHIHINITHNYLISLPSQEVASFRVLPQSISQDPLAALLLLAPLHHLPQSGRTLHHSFLLTGHNLANQKAPSWDHLTAL